MNFREYTRLARFGKSMRAIWKAHGADSDFINTCVPIALDQIMQVKRTRGVGMGKAIHMWIDHFKPTQEDLAEMRTLRKMRGAN
jgi:hypothetical protein